MTRRFLLGALLLGSLPALAWSQTTVVEYYHLDALGTVRAVTNQAGALVERHDYLPYGEEWCGTAVCASPTPGQPLRFTGKERDAETGLDYFGARYYGSKIGRFTTTDPVYTWQENLVDPQRWNRYAYARNNPLRYTDPDGRAINIPLAVGGAVLGGGIGFVGSAISQYVSTSHVNWSDALAAGSGGAVAGGLAGLTFGLAPALAGSYVGVATVGATTNVAGGMVTRSLDSSSTTKPIDFKEMGFDAGAGLVGSVGAKGLAASLNRTAAGYTARSSAYLASGETQMSRDAAKVAAATTSRAATVETVAGTGVTNAGVPMVRAAVERGVKEQH